MKYQPCKLLAIPDGKTMRKGDAYRCLWKHPEVTYPASVSEWQLPRIGTIYANKFTCARCPLYEARE